MNRRSKLAKISKNPANVRLRAKNKKERATEKKRWNYLESLQKQIVIKKYGKDCYTCTAKNLEGRNCQLGHVPWPRSILSRECAFSWKFTRIQCMACNINRGGMGAEAALRMQREGIDVEAMRIWNRETKGNKFSAMWREDQISLYESLLDHET